MSTSPFFLSNLSPFVHSAPGTFHLSVILILIPILHLVQHHASRRYVRPATHGDPNSDERLYRAYFLAFHARSRVYSSREVLKRRVQVMVCWYVLTSFLSHALPPIANTTSRLHSLHCRHAHRRRSNTLQPTKMRSLDILRRFYRCVVVPHVPSNPMSFDDAFRFRLDHDCLALRSLQVPPSSFDVLPPMERIDWCSNRLKGFHRLNVRQFMFFPHVFQLD